jgi:hypothetical protein
MGQHYDGPGIYTIDEQEPFRCSGAAAQDPTLYHEPSTYPGRRLPHAWLNTAVPQKPVSTIDLAGKGTFALFTGIGGEAWKEAAMVLGQELKVPLQAFSIGFRQDWEDVYFDWERVKGVEESGVVLVRPDRFVAWRCRESLNGPGECLEKLRRVMRVVLGWEVLSLESSTS